MRNACRSLSCVYRHFTKPLNVLLGDMFIPNKYFSVYINVFSYKTNKEI